jgi:pimeloyl-ACP methyl ester carboxylesterase
MAHDVLALMRLLGHQRFAVVGHDRGSYVAMRLAMDQPQAVTALIVLDSIPILEALERTNARFATAWWHWFFLAQPRKPEQAILADPEAWYGGDPEIMGADNYADYLLAIRDPATVQAMIEDYRAGLGVDREADEADRAAGRRISCPTLVLWSAHDDLQDLHGDILGIWRPWTTTLTGGPIDSGHHVAEEAPKETCTSDRRRHETPVAVQAGSRGIRSCREAVHRVDDAWLLIYCSRLTPRAITSTDRTIAETDSVPIRSLARGERGMVSVGLNAEELVTETYR